MADVGNFLKEWWNEYAYTDPRMNPLSPQFAPMEGAKDSLIGNEGPAIEKAPNKRSGSTPLRRRVVGRNMGANAVAGEIANLGMSLINKATRPYQEQLSDQLNTNLIKVGNFIDDRIHSDKWAGPVQERPGEGMGIMSSTFNEGADQLDDLVVQEIAARIQDKAINPVEINL